MRKIVLSIAAFALIQAVALAQAPAGFNYQGIVRNAAGVPLASSPLGMRITIRDGAATGPAVYQETHRPTTNAYGLYNVTIGSGTPITGTLGGVDWAAGSRYVQVEVDVTGGTAYADLGASQLMSVPYAMNAATAPPPVLSISNDTLSAGGNKIKLPAAAVYTGGTGITVTGTSIAVNNLSGDVAGAPNANTVAKIQGTAVATTTPVSGQSLKYNGTAWSPAADIDTQKLSISGSVVSLTNGGSVTLPAAPLYTGGTGITVTGTSIAVNNLAGDVTGAPNANTVGRIQGVAVATAAPTSGQVLRYNPATSAWTPATDTGYRGNATAGYLPVVTAPNTLGNSLLYQNGGRVGIGTLTMGGTLDVHGTTNGLLYSVFKNDNTGTRSRQEIQVAANNNYIAIGTNNDNSNSSTAGAYGYISHDNTRFAITSGRDDEQLTIDRSGNVGINQATPDALFHIRQNNRASASSGGMKEGMLMEYGHIKWSLGIGTNDGFHLSSYDPALGYKTSLFSDPVSGYTGIGNSTSPKSTLDVAGSVSTAIRTVAASAASTFSYTATADDYTIIASPGASVQVMYISLPAPASVTGRIYMIRRQPSAAPASGNAQAVNVRTPSGGAIFTTYTTTYGTSSATGVTGANLLTGAAGRNSITLQSDGTNWISIDEM